MSLKYYFTSLCVLSCLSSYAQEGGFYGPEDCVQTETHHREIVKSSEKINIHTYKSLCKSRPHGEIIRSEASCLGESSKVMTFAECLNERRGVKLTSSSNAGSLSPKYQELAKTLAKQSKSGKTKVSPSGGFYQVEDCVPGEWQQMEVSGKNEIHTIHSFSSLCKSKPSGEVIVARTECVGEGYKVPTLAECMKNSSSLLSKGSGNGEGFSQRYMEFSYELYKQEQQKKESPSNSGNCSKNDDGRSVSCPDGLYIKASSVEDSLRSFGKDIPAKEKKKYKMKATRSSKQ